MTELTESEKNIVTKYDLYFESRLSKTETETKILLDLVKEIKSDFKWSLGIIIGLFGITFSLMAKGFHWF